LLRAAFSNGRKTIFHFIKARWPKPFLLAKLKNKKSSTNNQVDLKLLIVLAFANFAALVYMLQKSN
jgi:hypothetical protein